MAGWMCIEINKRGIETAPDFITVDSADGGTGLLPHHWLITWVSAQKPTHGRRYFAQTRSKGPGQGHR